MPAPSPLVLSVLTAIFLAIVGAWSWVVLRLALGQPVLPPSTPRIVPWGAGSVLTAVLFWIALTASIPIAYRAALRPRPDGVAAGAVDGVKGRLELKPGEMMTLSAVQNAATLALIPLILAATCGARPRDFGVVGSGLGKQVARGMIAYPLLAPVVFGVMGASIAIWGRTNHPLENAIGQDRSPGMVIILALAAVVFAPAAEELIFRGVLLGWLTRLALGRGKPADPRSFEGGLGEFLPADRGHHLPETIEIESIESVSVIAVADTAELATHNPYAPPSTAIAKGSEHYPVDPRTRVLPLLAANAAVSLIFAALHGAVWPTPVPIFFLSLGLGFLYQRTGGILAPTALHMTFNGVSTLLMFLMLGGDPAPKPLPNDIDPIPPPARVSIDRNIFLSIRPVDGPGAI